MNRLFLALVSCLFFQSLVYSEEHGISFDPYVQSDMLPLRNLAPVENPGFSNAIELAPIKVTPHVLEANKKPAPQYAQFLSYVSPDYQIQKKLFLVQASATPDHRTIMFAFLMNNRQPPKPTQLDSDPQRKRVHILWTGSKKMFTEQKVIENEYPIDITMAHYSDGYAPGEWNVVLPNKKPREVDISLMWTF